MEALSGVEEGLRLLEEDHQETNDRRMLRPSPGNFREGAPEFPGYALGARVTHRVCGQCCEAREEIVEDRVDSSRASELTWAMLEKPFRSLASPRRLRRFLMNPTEFRKTWVRMRRLPLGDHALPGHSPGLFRDMPGSFATKTFETIVFFGPPEGAEAEDICENK